MQITSAQRAIASGVAAVFRDAGPLAAPLKEAERAFHILAVTANGITIQATQPFADQWAAQEYAREAAGEGGHVVEASPVVELTFLDGHNAHRRGRDCHANASEEARMGWARAEASAVAADRDCNASKASPHLARAVADRAQAREHDVGRTQQPYGGAA